jgi:hypothetical protein
MRPSSSAVALAESNAEKELLTRLASMTPRLTGASNSPRLVAAGAAGAQVVLPDFPSLTTSAAMSPTALGPGVIGKEGIAGAEAKRTLRRATPVMTLAASLMQQGVGTLVDDSFNRCFEETEPDQWNWNIYLFPAWFVGMLIRHLVLFPLRALALLMGMVVFFSGFVFVRYFPLCSKRHRIATEQK